MKIGTKTLKEGFAKMQKGGVIMDVVTPKQALIAEKAGAVAVMALHAVPADIRARGGVARMADPAIIEKIMKTVTIPVMAKVRIGHFAEAQVLEELGVDMIDESEVLTPADEQFHIDKKKFKIPFVCGARNLGEALRRMNEGAAMIRTKGEPGTGDVAEAVKHVRQINREVEELVSFQKHRGMLRSKAEEFGVPFALVEETAKQGRLPVVNFAAGGIATPADAALMMQLGVDGIFVGSGIFKSSHPERYAKAIVEATRSYGRPEVVLKVSKGLGDAMHGIDAKSLQDSQKMQLRSH
ncbi:MAG: pyridoxal 5'-phosphate synthase lyase subunit PdxS [Candidatus Micrarchaeota archaeon]|nr:pyridoxal 5'-phosphate synthase lyase subunit PdxS [Candidatus Micrarchaeota archaeon]